MKNRHNVIAKTRSVRFYSSGAVVHGLSKRPSVCGINHIVRGGKMGVMRYRMQTVWYLLDRDSNLIDRL
jgi:hypothetical protein